VEHEVLIIIDSSVISRKTFEKTNTNIFCSYNIISFLLNQFGLVIEYGKSEVFYFSRSYRLFNLPSLDFSCFEDSILKPKNIWCYLGFIFDRKLSFWQHIKFYSNKILLTIKCIKMLRNSTQSLLPQQKCLLYRICMLHIILYNLLL